MLYQQASGDMSSPLVAVARRYAENRRLYPLAVPVILSSSETIRDKTELKLYASPIALKSLSWCSFISPAYSLNENQIFDAGSVNCTARNDGNTSDLHGFRRHLKVHLLISRLLFIDQLSWRNKMINRNVPWRPQSFSPTHAQVKSPKPQKLHLT
jgi:hypothetical protein